MSSLGSEYQTKSFPGLLERILQTIGTPGRQGREPVCTGQDGPLLKIIGTVIDLRYTQREIPSLNKAK